MGILELLLYLLCPSIILTQNCPSKGISSHVILNDGIYRLTTLKRGNYTIQGLLTFTDTLGNCGTVTGWGLIRVYAMKYAIDRINNNKYLIPWGTLGLQLDNVCRSLPLTMARGIEVVSLHRPNSVCRADFLKCDKRQKLSDIDVKPATAIVGTSMSSTSIPLASLLSLYHIPQISYSASSRLLSKKDLYKSFFRTIPSDTNQISVMLEIIEKFKWNYVFAIGSDDDYGKLGISELKQNAQGKNICIAHDEYIPSDSSKTDAKVDAIIAKMEDKKLKDAKVVVLFCYVRGMGDKILRKAKSRGIERIWLTSEAWNPTVLSQPLNLTNYVVGILSVSLKTYPMQYIIDFMEREIKTNFQCDMWLQNFMEEKFKCKPTSLTADGMQLNGNGTGCPCNLTTIMKELSGISGTIYNLVDAVTALAHGIHNYLKNVCSFSNTTCSVNKISMKNLTKEMFNVIFTNEQGNVVSFNKVGDPKYAYYTIENVQLINGAYKYIPVGNWSDNRNKSNKLQLDEDNIKWPRWFNPGTGKKKHPSSRCIEDCQPGSFMVAKQECCWACQQCPSDKYTDTVNAMECKACKPGHHTPDKKHCTLTPVKWLKISDDPGMALVVITGIGITAISLAAFILIKYMSLIVVDATSPHIITLCCVLIVLTFGYGLLHVIKPSQTLCQAVNSIFYLFLMLYTAIVMIKTKFFTKYLMKHAKKSLRDSLLSAQMISLFLFVLLEAASIIAWFYIDNEQVKKFIEHSNEGYEIRLQCQVETTAARYVSTFIPIIILIIATFCAFRERNMEHSFYEPKFLSFTCIALCIIIVAFMPTFQYVDGNYKNIVMAITMDLFGFTFMGCLIFPKVYVAIMRHKRGAGQYPIKPGIEQQHTVQENDQGVGVPASQTTRSTVAETSINKDISISSVSIANGDLKGDTNFEHSTEKFKEANGCSNTSLNSINGHVNGAHDYDHQENVK